jgi:hypothetical protein
MGFRWTIFASISVVVARTSMSAPQALINLLKTLTIVTPSSSHPWHKVQKRNSDQLCNLFRGLTVAAVPFRKFLLRCLQFRFDFAEFLLQGPNVDDRHLYCARLAVALAHHTSFVAVVAVVAARSFSLPIQRGAWRKKGFDFLEGTVDAIAPTLLRNLVTSPFGAQILGQCFRVRNTWQVGPF